MRQLRKRRKRSTLSTWIKPSKNIDLDALFCTSFGIRNPRRDSLTKKNNEMVTFQELPEGEKIKEIIQENEAMEDDNDDQFTDEEIISPSLEPAATTTNSMALKESQFDLDLRLCLGRINA